MISQNQSLNILFYLKGKKATKDGKVPIYARVTIDGCRDEFSTGCKVFRDCCSSERKRVLATASDHRQINKKLAKVEVDLLRHFDLIQVKNGLAKPKEVIASYQAPAKAEKERQEKVENAEFSQSLDEIIDAYIKYNKKVRAAQKNGRKLGIGLTAIFDQKKKELEEKAEALAKKVNPLFDNKDRAKTIMLALNHYLLGFLQYCFVGERSPNTLEKLIGRKRRYQDFIQYRYKTEDIPLEALNSTFIEELLKHQITLYKIGQNAAMKYCQTIKEVMEIAATKKWVQFNVFSTFKCRYKRPKHEWLNFQECISLHSYNFNNEQLNEARDIYVFQSFCGFGYSDLEALKPSDIVKEFDGKYWIGRDRQKQKKTRLYRSYQCVCE